jgi:hypothetical protein
MAGAAAATAARKTIPLIFLIFHPICLASISQARMDVNGLIPGTLQNRQSGIAGEAGIGIGKFASVKG